MVVMDNQRTMTFDDALRGKCTALTSMIHPSDELFNELQDRNVLTRQQATACRVFTLCTFCLLLGLVLLISIYCQCHYHYYYFAALQCVSTFGNCWSKLCRLDSLPVT